MESSISPEIPTPTKNAKVPVLAQIADKLCVNLYPVLLAF